VGGGGGGGGWGGVGGGGGCGKRGGVFRVEGVEREERGLLRSLGGRGEAFNPGGGGGAFRRGGEFAFAVRGSWGGEKDNAKKKGKLFFWTTGGSSLPESAREGRDFREEGSLPLNNPKGRGNCWGGKKALDLKGCLAPSSAS